MLGAHSHIWGDVHESAHVCICSPLTHTGTYGGQKSMLGLFLNFSSPYFCSEDLSLNLVLVVLLDCLVPELNFGDPAVPTVPVTLCYR